jgi:hypothetical protein
MRTMPLVHLPVDVWFAIMEHFSLADLTALYTAFASSTAPVDVSVITRFAVNVISHMLAVDTCKVDMSFSANKLWYTTRTACPNAEERCHRNGDGNNLPSGSCGVYHPNFSETMQFSREFRSDPNDTTTTAMTISANDGNRLTHGL